MKPGPPPFVRFVTAYWFDFPMKWWYHIAESHTSIIFQMARTLAKRLANMNRGSRIVTPLVNITLVATNPNVQLSQFATHLASALSHIGSTLHLSSRWVERMWEIEGTKQSSANAPHNIKFDNWLNDQESKYQFMIYEADEVASHWTRRCIRQGRPDSSYRTFDIALSGWTVRIRAYSLQH